MGDAQNPYPLLAPDKLEVKKIKEAPRKKVQTVRTRRATQAKKAIQAKKTTQAKTKRVTARKSRPRIAQAGR